MYVHPRASTSDMQQQQQQQPFRPYRMQVYIIANFDGKRWGKRFHFVLNLFFRRLAARVK